MVELLHLVDKMVQGWDVIKKPCFEPWREDVAMEEPLVLMDKLVQGWIEMLASKVNILVLGRDVVQAFVLAKDSMDQMEDSTWVVGLMESITVVSTFNLEMPAILAQTVTPMHTCQFRELNSNYLRPEHY